MKKRLITGIILALILVPIMSFDILLELFQVVMSVFVVIAAIELIQMFETVKKFQKRTKIGIIILTLLTFFSVGGVLGSENHNPLEANGWLSISIPLITLILFGFLVFFKNFTGEDVGKALTVINYVGLGSASIVILRFLGVRFLVYLFLITALTDIFAYLFGVKFGKHKMAPDISPKKTWEGAIAGTVIATIIASCFALFYGDLFTPGTWIGDLFNSTGERTLLDNFSQIGDTQPRWVQSILLIPVTFFSSILGQIGDLVASKLKRTYKIKDFGKILPGHGGLLDRFDSAMFVAMFLTAVFLLIFRVF